MPLTTFPSICLVDFTNAKEKAKVGTAVPHGHFSPDELNKTSLALLKQLNRDVSPPPPYGYGLTGFVHSSQAPQPFEWVMGLFAHPDQPGALGYHDQTPQGLPLIKVFPFMDSTIPWSSIASHEILECVVDPNLCKCAQSPVDGKFYAYEVADPCEQDLYEIDDVQVSDFVLPPYYETPKDMRNLKFDFLGLITKALDLRPGGYIQYYDSAKGWQQVVHGRQSAYRAELQEGRGKRRRTGVTNV